MISYGPLAVTLRKRGMSFSDLLGRMGTSSGSFRRYLNEGRYISLKTVDRICTVLGCGVEDVVEWREGEMEVRECAARVSMDWEAVEAVLDRKNLTEEEVGGLVGRSPGWYRSARRNQTMRAGMARQLVAAIGGNWEECTVAGV